MDGKKLKKVRRRTTAAAAAVITAAGVVVGGSIDSPMELLDTDAAQTALTDTAQDTDTGDDGGSDTQTPNSKRREGRIRAWLLSLPWELRAAVGVPLWCIGWLVILFASKLWAAVLSPVLAVVLRWAAAAGILLLVLSLMLKAALPDMPVKRLLNKRSLRTLFAGVGILWLADLLLTLFLPDSSVVNELVRFIGPLLVLALGAVPVISAEVKRRQSLPAERSETPEEKEARLRRKAREIAESAWRA